MFAGETDGKSKTHIYFLRKQQIQNMNLFLDYLRETVKKNI